MLIFFTNDPYRRGALTLKNGQEKSLKKNWNLFSLYNGGNWIQCKYKMCYVCWIWILAIISALMYCYEFFTCLVELKLACVSKRLRDENVIFNTANPNSSPCNTYYNQHIITLNERTHLKLWKCLCISHMYLIYKTVPYIVTHFSKSWGHSHQHTFPDCRLLTWFSRRSRPCLMAEFTKWRSHTGNYGDWIQHAHNYVEVFLLECWHIAT